MLQIVNCLPTEHLRVLKNSLKRVRAFHIKMEFGSVFLFKEKGGKPKNLERNLSEQGRQATTNSTILFKLGPH